MGGRRIGTERIKMLLSPLIGTWRGEGAGEYPTIKSFSYTEELTIEASGKPFLTYRQRTWSPAGDPMHTEVGFLRAPSPETIEFIIAQPTGQTELLEGEYTQTPTGFHLELVGRIMNSGTAKQVDATQRRFDLAGDKLSYDFAMAAVGIPMTHHLRATLTRV